MPYLYKLQKNHNQIFKNNKPASLPYLLRTVFDFWELPGFNDEVFTSSYINSGKDSYLFNQNLETLFRNSGGLYLCSFFERELVSEQKKQEFLDKYVLETKTEEIFSSGTYLSEKSIKNILSSLKGEYYDNLVNSIKENGVKNPITIVDINDKKTSERIVLEGKHRMNIALLLELKSVPCFFLTRVGGEEPRPGWWVTFWEFTEIIRKNIQKGENKDVV